MKFLAFIPLLLSVAFAGVGRQTWQASDLQGKVKLLQAYQNWYAEMSAEKTTAHISFPQLISEAWASTEGMDCVYAGWPSKRVSGSCSSPQQQNPRYQAGSCAAGTLQCQPLFFGAGLCAPVATSQQRNLAFSSCRQQFERSGRSLVEVVTQLIHDSKDEELLELMDYSEGVCRQGLQSRTGMCRRLEQVVSNVREAFNSVRSAAEAVDEVLARVREVGRPTAACEATSPIVTASQQVALTAALARGSNPDTAFTPVTVPGASAVRSVAQSIPHLVSPRVVAAAPAALTAFAPAVALQVPPAPPQSRRQGPLDTGPTERTATERPYNSLPPAHNRPPALPVVDRGSAIYSPQTAFSDVLAEPLEFVGRGYTNPILDESGTPIEGNNACIYRNSRVYVVHSGCRPRANQALSVFDVRIYSRQGGMVAVNIESLGTGRYSIDAVQPNFRGGWSIEQRATAALDEDLSFTEMGNIHEDSLLNSVHICSAYGRPPLCSARGNTPAPAAMTQTWAEAATAIGQDVSLLRRVHDAVLNSPR